MSNEEILNHYYNQTYEKIYGYMYGVANPKFDIIDIPITSLQLSANKDAFYYVWGWPGPDVTKYNFQDYGKAWAFTKEEIIGGDYLG